MEGTSRAMHKICAKHVAGIEAFTNLMPPNVIIKTSLIMSRAIVNNVIRPSLKCQSARRC